MAYFASLIAATHKKNIAEPSVALVVGGALLGIDDQVHIDLDRSHTVLSPDDAEEIFRSRTQKNC